MAGPSAITAQITGCRRAPLALLTCLAALFLLAGVRVLIRASAETAAPPSYSVTQVLAGLASHPERSVGHVLLVRGTIEDCPGVLRPGAPPPCQLWQPHLADPAAPTTAPLLVAWGGLSPLIAFVRRVPLLSGLAPTPQTVRWDTPAVYRIRLHSLPCGPAEAPPCYEALLLDAAPDTR